MNSVSTEDILNQFYGSFSNKDINGMLSCYSDNVAFNDPAFGTLRGDRAKSMWKMLMSAPDSNLDVSFKILEFNENSGKVNWIANYNYGPEKRKVVNDIIASIEIENGKIVKHTDVFDIWKWTKQALGLPGLLLGWSPFMKGKVQENANKALDKFIKNQNN